MGISFDSNEKMVFNVTFGLSGACFNVNWTSVEFKLAEIIDYVQ